MSGKEQNGKDLFLVIEVLKSIAYLSRDLGQTMFCSEKIAKWLEEEGHCEVWPVPGKCQEQTGEPMWCIVYDRPFPGTFESPLTLSEELYLLARPEKRPKGMPLSL